MLGNIQRSSFLIIHRRYRARTLMYFFAPITSKVRHDHDLGISGLDWRDSGRQLTPMYRVMMYRDLLMSKKCGRASEVEGAKTKGNRRIGR